MYVVLSVTCDELACIVSVFVDNTWYSIIVFACVASYSIVFACRLTKYVFYSEGILQPFNPDSIRTSQLEIVVERLDESEGTISTASLDSRKPLLTLADLKKTSRQEKLVNNCCTCAEVCYCAKNRMLGADVQILQHACTGYIMYVYM